MFMLCAEYRETAADYYTINKVGGFHRTRVHNSDCLTVLKIPRHASQDSHKNTIHINIPRRQPIGMRIIQTTEDCDDDDDDDDNDDCEEGKKKENYKERGICNSSIVGLPKGVLSPLASVFNAAARLIAS